MIDIIDANSFADIIKCNTAVFAYFSHERCSVCKTLKPKLSSEISKHFPEIKQVYVDIEKAPEVAGQHSVFTVPVIIVFFEGQESIKKARNLGVNELMSEINRPYQMLFSS